jgi:hypothetical protein
MAERRRMSAREIGIGVAVMLVTFLVIFLVAGALDLPVPQWLLSAIAAVIGIVIWFSLIGRWKR